jgi:hypothetical protein
MQLQEANEVIWYGKSVLYDGREYTLTAVIKRKHHKLPEWYYQAELQDMTARHSVVIADLGKVTIK